MLHDQDIKPALGISGCLAHLPFRYNGDPVNNKFVHQICEDVKLVPVCPEMAIGLGSPRKELRLVGDQVEQPKLLERQTGRDYSARIQAFAETFAEKVQGLDGFIFKALSPTCGIGGVKVYRDTDDRQARGKTIGMFTRLLTEKYPDLAIEDEGRLNDSGLRFQFLHRIYASARWRAFTATQPSVQDLQLFHQQEKLLLMAFDQSGAKELGQLVAGCRHQVDQATLDNYAAGYRETFRSRAKAGRFVNALQHAVGYLSPEMNPQERAHISDCIAAYGDNRMPLSIPVELLKNSLKRYDSNYLSTQTLWAPWPDHLLHGQSYQNVWA